MMFFGRKTVTNLHSILKSRDITLLTKVHIVKALCLQVVNVQMWELDHNEVLNQCFQILVLVKILESSLDCKINPVNPKWNQSWKFFRRLILKLKFQYFGHLMQRADLLGKTLMLGKTDGRRRNGWQRMRCLDITTNSMDMSLNKLQDIVKDRVAWLAAVYEVTESWTPLSDWITTKTISYDKNHYNIVK